MPAGTVPPVRLLLARRQPSRVDAIPPSTSIVPPVTKRRLSEATHRTARAMSTGWTGRPAGVPCVIAARTSAESAFPGVDVAPGAT